MRLLANPLFIRTALGLFLFLAAFIVALFTTRALKRKLVDDESLPDQLGDKSDPTYAYSAVIQKLKQQKFELQSEHALQKRRAKASEHIAAAVIANLPCGVLFIGPNGLVKQANSAAKQILGFASPLGMNADELFRDSMAVTQENASHRVADILNQALRSRERATLACSYLAGNEARTLNLTVVPLAVSADDAPGLACVVADESATASERRHQLLKAEISAEMALELRTSLATIRECAEKIRSLRHENASSLASDIVSQAERLDKVVGGFLVENSGDRAFAARA